MTPLEHIRHRVQTFPDMPAFSAAAAAKLRDPNVDFDALAATLKYDPGLTANILHLANSALYGLAQQVGSLQEACVRIGLNKLLQLVVARGVADRLRHPLPGYGLRPEELLLHSVWVAVAAEELCGVLHRPVPATMFTAGLLHDLGKLIVDECVQTHRAELDALAAAEHLTAVEAEARVLGMTHAAAGAEIVARWQFPEELVEAIRWHHAPLRAERRREAVYIVHLANVLAHAVGIGAGQAPAAGTPAPELITRLSLTPDAIEYVAGQTLGKMRNLHAALAQPLPRAP